MSAYDQPFDEDAMGKYELLIINNHQPFNEYVIRSSMHASTINRRMKMYVLRGLCVFTPFNNEYVVLYLVYIYTWSTCNHFVEAGSDRE